MNLDINEVGGFSITDHSNGETSTFEFTGNLKALLSALAAARKLTRHMLDPVTTPYKNLEQVEDALKDGTLETNQFGGATLVYYVSSAIPLIYIWDVGEQELHKLGEPVGNNYLNMTGANYIEFTNNMGLFDFNKSWFMSIQTLTLHATGAFQGLFSLGDISFNFLTGTGNYGIYLDDRVPVTQGGSARSNTWHDPATLRILLNYNHVTQRLEYWTGAQGSTPVRIKDLDVNQYQGDPSQLYVTPAADEPLCIGKGLSGSNNFRGEVNDFIAGDTFLGATTVNNMFNATRDDLVAMSEVKFHAPIGEDTWPTTSCTGGLTGGTVVGGSAADFLPVPA